MPLDSSQSHRLAEKAISIDIVNVEPGAFPRIFSI